MSITLENITTDVEVEIREFVSKCFQDQHDREELLSEVFDSADPDDLLEAFAEHYETLGKEAMERCLGVQPAPLTERDKVLLENALRGTYRSCELVGVMTPELKTHLGEIWTKLNLSVDKPLTYRP